MKFFNRKKDHNSSEQQAPSAAPSTSSSLSASTSTSLSPYDDNSTTFRTTPHDELYGQHIPNETPELISSKLQDLEKELDLISDDDKKDWIMATQKCPDLCNNEKFKLMFLRCEIFNCDLAAKRIVKYWKKRVALFGQELAFQPLVLGPDGPFQKDDMALRQIAFMRCLNTRDLAGRPIVFGDPSRLPVDQSTYENESVARSLWYYLHALLENDETAQRKGAVFIMFPKNVRLANMNRKLAQMNADTIKGCVPIRISSIQICHPPKIFDLIFPIIKAIMGPHLRKKVQLNSGSDENVLKRLNDEFGISSEKLPTEMGGGLVIDHEKWLDERKEAGL